MIKIVANTGRKTKEKEYFYRDVQYDIDGWADATKWLPADYDLVIMRLKNRPTIVGWSVGKEWISLRLKDNDTVLQWRKKPEEKTP